MRPPIANFKNAAWLTALVLATLVCGYVTTANIFSAYKSEYLGAIVATALSMILALQRSDDAQLRNAALWLSTLVLLSSYCLKFFLIAHSPQAPVELGMVASLGVGEFDWQAVQIRSLLLSTLGIAAWGLTVFVVPRTKCLGVAEQAKYLKAGLNGKNLLALLLAASVLSAATAWLSSYYDIGLMGAEIGVQLPFRLRGVVYYLRMYFIPAVILLMIHMAFQSRKWSIIWIGVSLLMLNGFLDLAIRSSKSAVLWPIVYLLFLAVASGVAIRMKHVATLAGVTAPVLLLLPYMHVIRTSRVAGHGVLESIGSAASATDFHPGELLVRGLTWVIYRLPGTEILSAILGHKGVPVGDRIWQVLQAPNGVAGYLTNDIFLIPATRPHLMAPGYFGWWYLMFGAFGVAVGGIVLGLIVRVVWAKVIELNLHTAVLVRLFTLVLLFAAITEGTLDLMHKPLAAMAFSVLVLEGAIRLILLRQATKD